MAGSHCKDHMACSEAGIDHTGHVIIKADRCRVKLQLHKTGLESMVSVRKQQKEQPVLTPATCCMFGDGGAGLCMDNY